MTEDLRASLEQIALGAARALPPVEVPTLRRRLRRRRAVRRTVGVTAALVAATSVGAAAVALGALPGPGPVAPAEPTVQASPSPSPSATAVPEPRPTTPVAGWVPGGAPCGTTDVPALRESATVEVQGAVTAGDLDPTSAMFQPAAGGADLYVDVATTTEVPGQPAGDGTSHLQLLLLDETGTVAFWNDPARQLPQIQAADGSGVFSLFGLYDAVDCRTGQPLDGTYRVIASDADETVELAPVALGSAAGSDGASTRSRVEWSGTPPCGEPLPPATAELVADPDLVVALDPGVRLDDVPRAGLHAGATVTSAGGHLAGRVPQALRAFLVDTTGTVVSDVRTISAATGADTGTTFGVGAGGSFTAEVFQWFNGCSGAGPLGAGTYDLYVLDQVVATDDSGRSAPRTVAGGPFEVTLTGTW
jgi:hypothetical protein